MNIAKTVFGIIAIGSVLLPGFSLSHAANWTVYYKDGAETRFYDKDSVETPRKGVVWVTAKVSHLGDPEGLVQRLELSCNYRTFRVLSHKVDPVTGQYVPEGAAGGYKWTWFPYEAKITALYQNLCE